MQTEKCFCHFNGYEVKDAKARKNITKLESDIIEVNENANILDTKIEQNKGSINLANEEIANIKNSVASNAYDISVIATNTANANANIIKLENDITSLNNNLNQANENITNNSNNISALTETVNNIHTHDNKEVLDTITGELIERIEMGGEDKYRLSEETVTNKTWIDGKPIYRQVLRGVKTSSSNLTWNLSSYNIDYLLHFDGYLQLTGVDGYFYPINRYENNTTYTFVYYAPNSKVLSCNGGTSWSGGNVTIIIEYTKTTDEATITL